MQILMSNGLIGQSNPLPCGLTCPQSSNEPRQQRPYAVVIPLSAHVPQDRGAGIPNRNQQTELREVKRGHDNVKDEAESRQYQDIFEVEDSQGENQASIQIQGKQQSHISQGKSNKTKSQKRYNGIGTLFGRFEGIRQPLLNAREDQYAHVDTFDFQSFRLEIDSEPSLGWLVVDSFGQIMLASKVAYQIFQGGLNKFKVTRIQDLILQNHKKEKLKQIRSLTEYSDDSYVDWIIYSKSMKRKVEKQQFQGRITQSDLYRRYLKYIRFRIKPVKICLQSPPPLRYYWNKQLFPLDEPVKFFSLTVAQHRKQPDFTKLDLFKDKVIKKLLRFHETLNHCQIQVNFPLGQDSMESSDSQSNEKTKQEQNEDRKASARKHKGVRKCSKRAKACKREEDIDKSLSLVEEANGDERPISTNSIYTEEEVSDGNGIFDCLNSSDGHAFTERRACS